MLDKFSNSIFSEKILFLLLGTIYLNVVNHTFTSILHRYVHHFNRNQKFHSRWNENLLDTNFALLSEIFRETDRYLQRRTGMKSDMTKTSEKCSRYAKGIKKSAKWLIIICTIALQADRSANLRHWYTSVSSRLTCYHQGRNESSRVSNMIKVGF